MQNTPCMFNPAMLAQWQLLQQLPMVNNAWMEQMYGAALAPPSPPVTPRKKGFNIADILSEDTYKTDNDREMRRVASHPYYPAVQLPSHLTYSENTHSSVMRRQCRNKRVRTIFTPDQLEQLERIFEKQQYMVGSERYYLASKLQLSEAQVKVWFQNRRIKWRKSSGLESSHGSDMDDCFRSQDSSSDFSDSCSESGCSETSSL